MPDPGPSAGSISSAEHAADALLGPAEIRDLAARLGVSPRKSLGQNFLHDGNTVRRIVRLAGCAVDEWVVEVGPGLGSLTLGLLTAGARVTAVEVDPRLAASLPATVARHQPGAADRLVTVTADAVTLDPRAVLAARPPAQTDGPSARADGPRAPDDRLSAHTDGPSALVANLPYNVAVPVLLHALLVLPSIAHGLVMVQREVAERLVAGPGSRTYGVPSVKLAWYAKARGAGPVSRQVFWPEPNVDSALVAFTRHPAPPGDEALRRRTFALVDAAFAQRRKMLRGALAALYGGPDAAEAALRRADVDPSARGEALGLPDFVRLARESDRPAASLG